MLRYIFLVFLCINTSAAICQNAAEDLAAVYGNYSEMEYYTLDMTASQYFVKSGKKKNIASTKWVKSGGLEYLSAQGEITIQQKSYLLYVSESQKQIYYVLQTKDKKSARSPNDYKKSLEMWSKETATYLGEKSGIKTYRFTANQSGVSYVEVSVNMAEKSLDKMVYYYDPLLTEGEGEEAPSKTEITFSLSKTKPAESWFDSSKYIRIDGSKISLTEAYKKYKLVQN